MGTRLMRRGGALIALVCWGEALVAQCTPPVGSTPLIRTGEYAYSIESASGAVGDVVGVTVVLRSRLQNRGWISGQITLCHDPQVAELVGKPSFGDEFVSLLGVSGAQVYPVDEGAGLPGDHRGNGFYMQIGFERTAYDARFPSDVPLEVMTVYYRLKGSPGDAGALTFCEGVLARWNARCNYTRIHSYSWERAWEFVSTENVGGTLTVLEGPATHPDRPPEPPEAKVYPERPSDEAVNFRVRISGASAAPGARQVPVNVYVSAGVEYSGIQVPIDFDERYLRLARAEDHFITGTILVDNRDEAPGEGPDEGNAVIFSGLGVNARRLAPEGEEVHAATLYFDVLEAAADIASTSLDVEPVIDHRGIRFRPWIGVHHRSGLSIDDPTVRAEVAPIAVTHGVFLLRPETLVPLGDANFDGRLDISDPISLLAFLFLGGGAPACPGAADFDRNGGLDITDPVAALGRLFLWDSSRGGLEPMEVACR